MKAALLDPIEGRPGARRGRQEAKVRGGEDRLPGKAAQIGEKILVLLWVELGGHVVEQEQRRPAQDGAEVLDLRHLEREDEGALLPLAREVTRVVAVEREREVVHVRPDR